MLSKANEHLGPGSNKFWLVIITGNNASPSLLSYLSHSHFNFNQSNFLQNNPVEQSYRNLYIIIHHSRLKTHRRLQKQQIKWSFNVTTSAFSEFTKLSIERVHENQLRLKSILNQEVKEIMLIHTYIICFHSLSRDSKNWVNIQFWP